MFTKPAIAIFVIVGTLLSIALTMVQPYFIGQLFDRLWDIYLGIAYKSTWIFWSFFRIDEKILIYVILLFGTGILSFIVNILVGILNEYIAQVTETNIRQNFYESVQSKSMAFHDTAKIGDLMSQATFDVRIINATVSPGLRMIVQAIATALIAFGYLFAYDWRISLSVLGFLPFYVITVIRYSRKLQPLAEAVQKQFGVCNAHLLENVSGIRVVRAFTAEKYEVEKFKKEIDTLKDGIIKRGIQQAKYFPPLILSLSITLALGIGVYLITIGQMTGGEVIAINSALVRLYDPTYQISWVISMTNMGLAGAKRILKTMKEEEITIEKPNAIKLKNIFGKVEYRNVSFSYQNVMKKTEKHLQEESDKINVETKEHPKIRETLTDINFIAEPGDIVAILGPTGSGKSILTKLLGRLYDVDKGEILIDDQNIKNLTLESLRKNIGVIEQDIFLFSTTIKENIAYGIEREVTDEEIIEHAKAAQAHEFIMSFKDGYDTLVGERGVTLSGGQKQRIAIARAFIANPKILILDDSASAIDAQTEEKIQLAMNKLLQNRTVFIITHRLSAIKRANKIIVIRKGRIVAQGEHEQLLRTSEDYRRVFGRHLELPPLEAGAVSGIGSGR